MMAHPKPKLQPQAMLAFIHFFFKYHPLFFSAAKNKSSTYFVVRLSFSPPFQALKRALLLGGRGASFWRAPSFGWGIKDLFCEIWVSRLPKNGHKASHTNTRIKTQCLKNVFSFKEQIQHWHIFWALAEERYILTNVQNLKAKMVENVEKYQKVVKFLPLWNLYHQKCLKMVLENENECDSFSTQILEKFG